MWLIIVIALNATSVQSEAIPVVFGTLKDCEEVKALADEAIPVPEGVERYSFCWEIPQTS